MKDYSIVVGQFLATTKASGVKLAEAILDALIVLAILIVLVVGIARSPEPQEPDSAIAEIQTLNEKGNPHEK